MDDSSFFALALTEDQQRQDASLLVRFELEEVEDRQETKKSGFPVYKKLERVHILIPGSREERVHTATREHQRRFPRAYAAFKSGLEVPPDGTAVRDWAGAGKGDAAMLVHHGVASVEQLAALSDENLSLMGHGIRPLRDRARSWVEARKAHKPIAELQAQLKEKDAETDALKARLAALEAHMLGRQVDASEVAPKKRVRKTKAAQPEG
jgi:hypothetical protein